MYFLQADGKAAKSIMHVEEFKDFSQNAYRVTIARVQQLALKKAGAKAVTPQEQLAVMAKNKEKRTRAGAVSPE